MKTATELATDAGGFCDGPEFGSDGAMWMLRPRQLERLIALVRAEAWEEAASWYQTVGQDLVHPEDVISGLRALSAAKGDEG